MAAAVHICVSCSTSSTRSSSSSNHSNGNTKGGEGKRGAEKGVGVHSSNSSSSFGSVAGRGNGQTTTILQIYSVWALITLLAASVAIVQSAAVSFGDLLSHPTFKPLCSPQHEHYIESEGKESSLIIELKPGSYGAQHSSCSRILSAPADYGFIVRLILPKLRHQQTSTGTSIVSTDSSTTSIMPATSTTKPRELATGSALSEVSTLIERLNSTVAASGIALTAVKGRTCPLSIFSSLDPHTPQWRVDPCQLEDTAPEMEDPVRLFHGRVRIVWEHGQQALKTKLMVTVLGKGEQCNHGNKHQCLKIGDEPLLCISKELACDGIRHCPYSNEYDSDEDYELCFKHRRPGGPQPTALESDLFEQFALEVFRNLFAYDAPTAPDEVPFKGSNSNGNSNTNNESSVSSNPELMGSNVTTLRKVHTNTKDMKRPNNGDGSPNAIGPKGAAAGGADGPKLDHNVTDTAAGSGFTRRNSTRNGAHSDLSKYGPWGYLMLGMLLCGGALLICGLWASASQHAVNNEREAALAAANGAGMDPSSVTSPPNYEELDPPPAYSVLFPNQKATSSTVLNTMDQASTGPGSTNTTTTTTTTTSAAAAAAESITEPQQEQQQQQQ